MEKQDTPKSQIEKFREAAREIGADDSEEAFNANLKRIAKPTPAKAKVAKPEAD